MFAESRAQGGLASLSLVKRTALPRGLCAQLFAAVGASSCLPAGLHCPVPLCCSTHLGAGTNARLDMPHSGGRDGLALGFYFCRFLIDPERSLAASQFCVQGSAFRVSPGLEWEGGAACTFAGHLPGQSEGWWVSAVCCQSQPPHRPSLGLLHRPVSF